MKLRIIISITILFAMYFIFLMPVVWGGAYMILCDLLARVLPDQGEIPVGVITAMIGAPIFIFLLKRSRQ